MHLHLQVSIHLMLRSLIATCTCSDCFVWDQNHNAATMRRRCGYSQAIVLPICAYAVKVAWSSIQLPMACSNTTTSSRRLSTPHEASAPIMALSYVAAKPLCLSLRSWYYSWARNVETFIIPMWSPVLVHPGRMSFKRDYLTSTKSLVLVQLTVYTSTVHRNPCPLSTET